MKKKKMKYCPCMNSFKLHFGLGKKYYCEVWTNYQLYRIHSSILLHGRHISCLQILLRNDHPNNALILVMKIHKLQFEY